MYKKIEHVFVRFLLVFILKTLEHFVVNFTRSVKHDCVVVFKSDVVRPQVLVHSHEINKLRFCGQLMVFLDEFA